MVSVTFTLNLEIIIIIIMGIYFMLFLQILLMNVIKIKLNIFATLWKVGLTNTECITFIIKILNIFTRALLRLVRTMNLLCP